MNEVSKKSVNGGSQVSGGFIFDQMDRFARGYVEYHKNQTNMARTVGRIFEF